MENRTVDTTLGIQIIYRHIFSGDMDWILNPCSLKKNNWLILLKLLRYKVYTKILKKIKQTLRAVDFRRAYKLLKKQIHMEIIYKYEKTPLQSESLWQMLGFMEARKQNKTLQSLNHQIQNPNVILKSSLNVPLHICYLEFDWIIFKICHPSDYILVPVNGTFSWKVNLLMCLHLPLFP